MSHIQSFAPAEHREVRKRFARDATNICVPRNEKESTIEACLLTSTLDAAAASG